MMAIDIGDILEHENKAFNEAIKEHGDFFINAVAFNGLLNNFIEKVEPDSWIFILFLNQVRKHHLLALLSTVRKHHVQSMMNMRQVLEAGVNAAYGLANPKEEDFVVRHDNGTMDATKKLNNKRIKWLENNYSEPSGHIKSMKKSVNKSCAHSNMIYAFNNFKMDGDNRLFEMPFFDKDDEYLTKTDLWMIGNVAMGLMDLFNGVNQSSKRVTFVEDFSYK